MTTQSGICNQQEELKLMAIPPPPLINPQQTTPYGNPNDATFHQVPFIRLHERVHSGGHIRKAIQKYVEANAAANREYASSLQSQENALKAMLAHVIPNTAVEVLWGKLVAEVRVTNQSRMLAHRKLLDIAQTLDHSSRVKKWNNGVYNLVQKAVNEVNSCDRKTEKAIARKNKAIADVNHWTRIHDAAAVTLQIQSNNQDCLRAVQNAETKLCGAMEEQRVSFEAFIVCQRNLHAAIAKRDIVIEDSTQALQKVEIDRLESLRKALTQTIASRRAELEVEMQELIEMETLVETIDTRTILQQFIQDSKKVDLTHRQNKALHVLDWHFTWHDQQLRNKNLQLEGQFDASRYLSDNFKAKDIAVIQDFVACCFVEPDRSQIKDEVSKRHRSQFCNPTTGPALFSLEAVRKVFLHSLNTQRVRSQELSSQGYDAMATSLNMIFRACEDKADFDTAHSLMNMLQTFYHQRNTSRRHLIEALKSHTIWQSSQYWGESLLQAIGKELSKAPYEEPWFAFTETQRVQAIVHVHNVIFGQLGTFIYNMAAFGIPRTQIQQFVGEVVVTCELSEEQDISLRESVNSVDVSPSTCHLGRFSPADAAACALAMLPEFSQKAAKASSNGLHDPFARWKLSQPVDILNKNSAVAIKKAHCNSWEDLFGAEISPGPEPDAPAAAKPPPTERVIDDHRKSRPSSLSSVRSRASALSRTSSSSSSSKNIEAVSTSEQYEPEKVALGKRIHRGASGLSVQEEHKAAFEKQIERQRKKLEESEKVLRRTKSSPPATPKVSKSASSSAIPRSEEVEAKPELTGLAAIRAKFEKP